MADWRNEAKALAAQSKARRRIGTRARQATRRAVTTIKQAEEQRLARITLRKALTVS